MPKTDPHFGPSLVLARTVALLNAAGPPAREAATAGAVEQVLRAHGEPELDVATDELPALVEVLGRLFDVCAATSDNAAAQAINELFDLYAHRPRLTAHDGTRWHLHVDSSDAAPLHEWIATSGALAPSRSALRDRSRQLGNLSR
jgi:hypothetical protein